MTTTKSISHSRNKVTQLSYGVGTRVPDPQRENRAIGQQKISLRGSVMGKIEWTERHRPKDMRFR